MSWNFTHSLEFQYVGISINNMLMNQQPCLFNLHVFKI